MTAPDVQAAELEELLIYDDLFLELFQAFLALPAFPVRIFYDRLTGNVRDLDGALQDGPLEYGADEKRRETTLFWLRQERLPLFRKSHFYLEYKLTKLLVRPLEDPQPTSRYDIRGYSRQTDSAALSTAPCSAVPQQFSAPGIWSAEPLGSTGGFPSRVHSTPAAPGYESDTYRLSLLERYGDAIMRLCQPADHRVEDGAHYMDFTHSDTTERSCPMSPGFQLRAEASTRAEDQKDTRGPGSAAWKSGAQGTGWADPEDLSVTEEEENFVKQHNLTMSALQQLKEEALSSVVGFGRFVRFLQDTRGIHLLHFWMDCEAFKDTSVDLAAGHSPEDARHLCVHLFRSIQNKYQFCLSPECQEQIRQCQQSRGASYHALRRPQYDALRRLRSYWIPRFLIHRQRRQQDSRPDGAGVRPVSAFLDAADHLSPVTGAASTARGMRDSDAVSSSALPDRMIPALRLDAAAGGPFLHYLHRFQPPKTIQIFLLWQELNEYGEWGTERNRSGGSQRPSVCGDGHLHRGPRDPAPGGNDLSGGIQLADLGSTYHLALDALRDPWIQFLNYDITTFLKFCAPLSLEFGSSATVKKITKQKRSDKENRHWGLHQGGGKKVKRKKDPSLVPGPLTLEMLQHRAVYKAYKKLVQETEEPQTLRVLEMLHALQSTRGERDMLALIQKVLELDVLQNLQLQELRRHLRSDLSRGAISSSSISRVTGLLGALLDVSFHKFWGEISGRLKVYGVEQSGNEGWARLEPILLVLSTKIATKRLHGQRSDVYHPAQMQPSVDDVVAFHQAIGMAAQGWPTPEILHFLKYLQTHGPQEGLPLLENNLLCCLELRKYRNAHHAMPDRGLLKRKVHVLRERFLLLHENGGLQLSPELLEAAQRDTEAATHSDLPSTSLFDHLQDWLTDSLLPFWAGFRRAWAVRSPSSAQREPVLRMQQMLRKRLALFEVEETPLKTFHLPQVQLDPSKAAPSMVTFSFSMTNGLSLKESSAQTPDPPLSRSSSQTAALTSMRPTSPEPPQLDASAVARIPDERTCRR
ncbi:uncharacterized protein [Phyllobates terribilis]|uniref:uncharacterized protein n=1 Tax=Phyllobates terribilis TaxID=111132 RepID=UPI003CCB2C0A